MKKILLTLILVFISTGISHANYECREGVTDASQYNNLSKNLYDRVIALSDKFTTRYSQNGALNGITKLSGIIGKLELIKSQRELTIVQTEIIDLLGFSFACSIDSLQISLSGDNPSTDVSDPTSTSSSSTSSSTSTSGGTPQVAPKVWQDGEITIPAECGFRKVDDKIHNYEIATGKDSDGNSYTKYVRSNKTSIKDLTGHYCKKGNKKVFADWQGNDGTFNLKCYAAKYPSGYSDTYVDCEIQKKITPKCGSNTNTCSAGTYVSTSESGEWKCKGNLNERDWSKPKEIVYKSTSITCQEAPECGGTTYYPQPCKYGTYVNRENTDSESKWACQGIGSKTTTIVNCSKAFDWTQHKPGKCGNITNTCEQGTLEDVSDTSTYNKWNCIGTRNGERHVDACESSINTVSFDGSNMFYDWNGGGMDHGNRVNSMWVHGLNIPNGAQICYGYTPTEEFSTNKEETCKNTDSTKFKPALTGEVNYEDLLKVENAKYGYYKPYFKYGSNVSRDVNFPGARYFKFIPRITVTTNKTVVDKGESITIEAKPIPKGASICYIYKEKDTDLFTNTEVCSEVTDTNPRFTFTENPYLMKYNVTIDTSKSLFAAGYYKFYISVPQYLKTLSTGDPQNVIFQIK